MALINKSFGGKLTLDDSPYQLPLQDYIEAINITRDSQGSGQDKVVANILGNQKVLYNLRGGTNKEIGKKEDVVRNRIYYWIWHSGGYNLWLYYDANTDSIVKLIEDLTDTGGTPVLDFDPSFKINHADIVYRDEGDLVSWTDNHTAPKEANVTTVQNGGYGVILAEYIEAAKKPPIHPPTCVYQNDTTRLSNSLRKKLFQFSYAYQYDTFAISTPSTFSAVPLPIGEFGSDNDLDSSNNNVIAINIETGAKNVTDLYIYMRNNIADAWGDFVTVVVLNKAQLLIPDDSTYQFLFYNDNLYPPPTENFQYVNGVQSVPLFDWCPQLAIAQCQANGNTKVYGGITEDYNNYPTSELNVTLTAANETNAPPDTNPPQLTYTTIGTATFVFTVSGSVPVGTSYKIYIFFNGVYPQTHGVFLVGNYTSIGGDTTATVATALYNQFNAYPSNPVIGGSHSGGTSYWQSNIGTSGSYVFRIDVVAGSVSGISTQKTWLWDCSYALGIVYVDEQNRDMPGVTTFSNPTGGNNDFVVTTPSFSLDSTTPQTPVLSFSINHLPPAGAVAYHLVRRRLAFGTFMFYETCDYQDPSDGYVYFSLANIEKFKIDNSQFIYGTAPITAETRIKIIAGITSGAYNGTLYTQDFQIVGTVVRTLTGGSSPDNDVTFIKVVKPTTISPAFTVNMLVMVYTPLANPTSDADSVYWEWGQTYDIYTSGGTNYHRGLDQDQTAIQAATFTFDEGDVYYRDRNMYPNIVGTSPFSYDTLPLMDANYSDYFDSLVNDNGRGQAIEANARHQFNPVLLRRSEAYQNDTSINGLNRFYPENLNEADRSWDSIMKLFIDRRFLYVGQVLNVGVIPVLQQIVTDTAGNPLQADSEILLNKIQYPYQRQYGYGNVPESFAYGKDAIYGVDNNKAIVWRLTPENGMEAISVLYDCNAYFTAQLAAYKGTLNNGNPPNGGVYTGNPTVYGVFDSYTNKYIIAMEEINRYNSQGYITFHQDPATICFLETRDETEGFESNYTYYPEGLASLNNLLVTFKNGELWKHNSNVYCNFYNVQFSAYITAVFNEGVLLKKTWAAVTQISNTTWACPVIYTNVMSYGTQRQESELIEQDFTLFEQMPTAGFLRDKNSVDGLLNGQYLKGNFMVIRFTKVNANVLVILAGASIEYKDSALTAK